MKICPRCNKTYTDENLNFCLDDGSVLNQAGGAAMPETVMMNQVRPTQPNPSMPSQQVQPGGWNTAPQQQQQPGQYSMQPKKSSKTWMWVVGILGLVVLICGGGGIGLLIFVGSQAEIESNTATNRSNTSTNQGRKSTTTPSSSPSTDPGPTSDRSTVEKVDLSEWVRPFSAFGTTEMSGSDFVMAAKQKGYYYVLAAPKDTAQTEQANTSVTLKNVDNADSRLGYGIVFHSNPTPLQQGYAFLIDSKKKKYRIVHHSPGKEDEVVKWTNSDLIKTGSEENTLEVRDLTDKIELYINGTMVNSIKNVYGFKGGVVGLYSGDAVKVGFNSLELRK
ncbi:MAG: hypothetical protein IPN51_15290 [Chloracidobacterium sp.]|nr:hypothetical protein [Chloracidobacterium sp.]